ncbi:MAG: Ldh family oxidoreductase [Bacillota bacterium]
MPKVDSQKLYMFCNEVFIEAGIPKEHGHIMAHALVEADLMGVTTHGASRTNIYLEHMENGTINPEPKIEVVSDFASISVIDADRAMGPVAADYAMKKACVSAAKTGVGVVCVRNSTHMGALSVTAKKACDNKMIGLVISNTSPIMAAWGGAEPVLGNNPISIAVPTGEGSPYVLDIALSLVARGNIILAAREGREIPENWAVDNDGRPTTNAQEALLGAVLPLAQHKGYALAFMFDVLSAVLSGAAYGKNVGSFVPPDYSKPLNFGHFILALDINKILKYDDFLMRLKDYVKQLKTCKKAQGFQEILVPGEIESKKYEENLVYGVNLSDTTVEILRKLGEKYKIDTTL